ncbi:hypothetical protein [Actinomadura xylanilytica]|uniref:hypothetical protein n=1 Tax=Actinomadura xylanilytica TaxID=887459 RepID=UPI00255B1F0F|nr:hypothetical protein [Actinomadura xylanilytica]MDL4777394.1 hypothetical protein [Actinomadura xylanilytica]
MTEYELSGADGVYFLRDQDDQIAGTLLREAGGWWRGVAPDGRVRKFFIAPDEDGEHGVVGDGGAADALAAAAGGLVSFQGAVADVLAFHPGQGGQHGEIRRRGDGSAGG